MAATRARSRAANAKRPRRQVQLPPKYSHDFPVRGEGHNYTTNQIPTAIWERAKKRAHGEEKSIRTIIIRALDLYGSGRLDL